uniref:Uncharacterized protein n=1 Tax=Clastoptera arizonana TaxID=38151 RepID=A0A1B6D179_9HEMI
MANKSITSLLKWSVISDQCGNDSDSTLSDLDELSQSLLQKDFQIREVEEKGWRENINKYRNEEIENSTELNLSEILVHNAQTEAKQNNYFDRCKITENVDNNSEVSSKINKNEHDLEEIISFSDIFNDTMCLTEVVGKTWSQEIKNTQKTVIKTDKKDTQFLIPGSLSTEKIIPQNKVDDNVLRSTINFNEKECEIEKRINNIHDDKVVGISAERTLPLEHVLLKGKTEIMNKNLTMSNPSFHEIHSNPKQVELVDHNTYLRNPCKTHDKMEICNSYLSSSEEITGNSISNYSEGSTLILKETNTKNTLSDNDSFNVDINVNTLNTKNLFNNKNNKYVKQKLFPKSLNHKKKGAPPKKQLPKRMCTLKAINVFKKIPSYDFIDEHFSSKPKHRKKKKDIFTTDKLHYLTDIAETSSKTTVKTSKKQKQRKFEIHNKSAQSLVHIGLRLDEINTTFLKWTCGDTNCTISREEAVNMLHHVKIIQDQLREQHPNMKTGPVQKLLTASYILELQIGKAISDADLLYKTEELNRIQMLKKTFQNNVADLEDEVDSQQFKKRKLCHTNQPTTEVNEKEIIDSFHDLSLEFISEKPKSILKCITNKANNNEKKYLNFSDEIEYFEILQNLPNPSKENSDENCSNILSEAIEPCEENNINCNNFKTEWQCRNNKKNVIQTSKSNNLQECNSYLNEKSETCSEFLNNNDFIDSGICTTDQLKVCKEDSKSYKNNSHVKITTQNQELYTVSCAETITDNKQIYNKKSNAFQNKSKNNFSAIHQFPECTQYNSLLNDLDHTETFSSNLGTEFTQADLDCVEPQVTDDSLSLSSSHQEVDEDSWRQISFSNIVYVRRKTEAEYHRADEDDGDWFSGWM